MNKSSNFQVIHIGPTPRTQTPTFHMFPLHQSFRRKAAQVLHQVQPQQQHRLQHRQVQQQQRRRQRARQFLRQHQQQ